MTEASTAVGTRAEPAGTITRASAKKILSWIDKGLTPGKGKPKPGQMCIEAVICNVLEGRHDDNPKCVAPVLRSLKVRLNDANWSSNKARAKGMRRLGLAQLGSAGVLDENEFRRRIIDLAIRKSVPAALRSAASVIKDEGHKAALCEAANRCEKEGTRKAALDAKRTAYAAAYAAAAAAAYAAAYAAAAKKSARDKSLAEYTECVVQILIDMKAPGCQWLSLTE